MGSRLATRASTPGRPYRLEPPPSPPRAYPVVRLLLEVIPALGGANYATEVQTAVSKIAVPRVGDGLPVFVNPSNSAALALAV